MNGIKNCIIIYYQHTVDIDIALKSTSKGVFDIHQDLGGCCPTFDIIFAKKVISSVFRTNFLLMQLITNYEITNPDFYKSCWFIVIFLCQKKNNGLVQKFVVSELVVGFGEQDRF